MRIFLFALVFICSQFRAQEYTKSALTAGSEFLDKGSEQNKSITLNETVNCPFDVITRPKNTFIAPMPQSVEIVSSRETHSLVYVGLFLLIGCAVYFFTSRHKSAFASEINLEDEEDTGKKKELWQALSEPETE